MIAVSQVPTTQPAGRFPVLGAALLLTPTSLVGLSIILHQGRPLEIAAGFAGILLLIAIALIARNGVERSATGPWLLLLFLIAYLTLQFNSPDFASPVLHGLMAASLLTPVSVFLYREMTATAGSIRKAKFILKDLLTRTDWPENFEDYRSLTEVRTLREHLRDNPAPILPILSYPDERIQIAALWAMEFQPIWKNGQPEVVIHTMNMTDEPAVKEAAVVALGNVRKPRHLVCMLPLLRDPSKAVRRAASLSILWKADTRWGEIRESVRASLADPVAERDGPLPCTNVFPPTAIDDLVRWSSESGCIGKRATQSLIRFCKKALHEDGSEDAIARVTTLVSNPKVPAGIRVELAHRLKEADEFAPEVAARLIGANNPTMLRLLAAGALLAQRGEDARAIDVLKEAAKHPNREISLAAAVMIQKYLGIDMGLPVGGDAPAANTRLAAEVARKVLNWASQNDNSPPASSDGKMPRPVPAY